MSRRAKPGSREATVRKKKYRRWLRRRGLPVTKYNYKDQVMPS